MLQKGLTVATEDERHVQVAGVLQCIGVVESLLHAAAQRIRPLLRLNDGERDVGFVEQQVVYLFLTATTVLPSGPSRHNPPICEGVFLPDSVHWPARILNRRRDVTGARFLFGYTGLAHVRRK
jgi:hypothetical protein